MHRWVIGWLWCIGSVTALAQWDGSAQVRTQWDSLQAASDGPLAQANALAPGSAPGSSGGATLQAELRAKASWVHAVLTLETKQLDGQPSSTRARLNELEFPFELNGWQGAVGKKVVAWDVGYGFRPNDMVQQEARRTLVSSAAEGRPVLLLEHFSAERAWSWVAVNPAFDTARRAAHEPALAARLYQRDGALDWHGFARVGARTAGSVGTAFAWVAGDALELHGSWRYQRRVDGRSLDVSTGVASVNPWRDSTLDHVQQLLVGATWTHASQISVLAEAWWDGAAPSDAQWAAWGQRNRQLQALAAWGAPTAAVAGNLAWQADAFGVASNLRRSSVLVRVSWQSGAWQTALDCLYSPADEGRLVSASLAWQGDRVWLQGGVRVSAGAAQALFSQLPQRQQAYASLTWSF